MDPKRPESNFWVTVGTKELEVLNSAINQLGNQESPIFSGISIASGEPYYLLLSSSGPKIPRSIPPRMPSVIWACWQQWELCLPERTFF